MRQLPDSGTALASKGIGGRRSNIMMVSGLLWYDDDVHRPLAQKVAEAAQRYRERVGYEPTTCQLNPSLIPTSTQVKSKRAAHQRSSALPVPLRLEPNEHLRPNYFYVGVLAGERLKRATDHRAAQHRGKVAGATSRAASEEPKQSQPVERMRGKRFQKGAA